MDKIEQLYRRRAVRWANRQGVPIRWRKWWRDVRNENGLLHLQGCETIQIVHEVHHWMVATARARRIPNYGLGGSTDSDSKLLVSMRAANLEELAVTVLDVSVLLSIQFPLGRVWSWWAEVATNDRSLRNPLEKACNRLRSRRLRVDPEAVDFIRKGTAEPLFSLKAVKQP